MTSWAEADPVGAAKEHERLNRLSRIRQEIENLSLSEFSVGDFEALFKIMTDWSRIHEKDMERLEKRISNIKNKKKS